MDVKEALAKLESLGIETLRAQNAKRGVTLGDSLGIYRDYPVSKGCTSPFAPIWIAEMVRRQA